MKPDPLCKKAMDEFRNMICGIGKTFCILEHPGTCGKLHFGFLEMKTGIGEILEGSCMIIMKMGDDHILNPFGIDSQLGQSL